MTTFDHRRGPAAALPQDVAMTDHLVDAYRQAGGQAEVVIFPNVGHSFANFPSPEADECIAQMKTFVAAQLARLDR